jgi:SAM-dependent methyltransferase
MLSASLPMDDNTAAYLNTLNCAFYAATAADFHATRGQAWQGWARLLVHLQTPLSVLDVGCGNGRFGVYLVEQGKTPLIYHGLDNSTALLAYAKEALPDRPDVQTRFRQYDLLHEPLPEHQYDLVTLFGVMHHIPGAARRLAFMRALSACVKPGGLFAFACWRFYEYPRFRARIIPWSQALDVETNDYLLDWKRGTTALRYCHYVDDSEHAALVAATGMTEVETYRADGEGGQVNRYSLLRASS